MLGAEIIGPRFNIIILRDSDLLAYVRSAGPLRHLGSSHAPTQRCSGNQHLNRLCGRHNDGISKLGFVAQARKVPLSGHKDITLSVLMRPKGLSGAQAIAPLPSTGTEQIFFIQAVYSRKVGPS